MSTLRIGEFLIEQCAGGKCVVCKGRIPPGPANQLSSHSAAIRHVECLPKKDTRVINDLRMMRGNRRAVQTRGAKRK